MKFSSDAQRRAVFVNMASRVASVHNEVVSNIFSCSPKLTKFSFWERKHKGWYPADSKLPDEFPTIVRGVAFEILAKNHSYITPDDDIQLVKLTGDVCAELDKIWKSEWGVRPSGHYLQADVKDAWEDLD